MAHVMKLTKAGVGHMFAHYERRQVNGEYVKFGNYKIDPERTGQNYNLVPDRGVSQLEFLERRLSEVHCHKRKDVNVVCSWVVTMPKDLDPSRTHEFMQGSFDFLSARYGAENVVSAYVHLDEERPHIHFAFVPVTYDRKKELYKVCAKEVVSREDLRSFHRELKEYLEGRMRCPVNVLLTPEQRRAKKLQAEQRHENHIAKQEKQATPQDPMRVTDIKAKIEQHAKPQKQNKNFIAKRGLDFLRR